MTSRLRLTGHERLYGSSAAPGDAAILEFWRWAFSDLRTHSVREVFAEWMVAKLLDIRLGARDVQKEYDLIAPNGVRIEVKTAAYLQGEQTERPSQIVFSGLRARKWDAQAQQHPSPTAYNADLYVFCVQIEEDAERWDALDLSQWRFYTVTGAEIHQLGARSITLGTLRNLCQEMRARAFQVTAARLIRALGKSYNAGVS